MILPKTTLVWVIGALLAANVALSVGHVFSPSVSIEDATLECRVK